MARKKKNSDAGGLILIILIVILILVLSYIPTALMGFILWKCLPDGDKFPKNRKSMLIWGSLAVLALGGLTTWGVVTAFKTGEENELFKFSALFASWGYGLAASIPFVLKFFSIRKQQTVLQGEADDYEEMLLEALSDGTIDEKETEALSKILSEGNIAAEAVEKIHHDVFINTLYSMAEDGVVDENEVQALAGLAGTLGISDEFTEYADNFIEQRNTLHLIQQGHLPSASADDAGYILKKNEDCYFCEETELYEEVTETAFVGTSIALGKVIPGGTLFNPRVFGGKRIAYDKMKHVDSGFLIITSKRTVFLGNKITRDFLLNKILGISIADDAIQINRAGKKKREVFKLTAIGKDTAAAIINSIVREAE
jgi:hypothetical protein